MNNSIFPAENTQKTNNFMTVKKVEFLLGIGAKYIENLILKGKINAFTKEDTEGFFVRESDIEIFPSYEKPLVPIKNSDGYYSALQISKRLKMRHGKISFYIESKKIKPGGKLKNGALFMYVEDWNDLEEKIKELLKKANAAEARYTSFLPYCPFEEAETKPLEDSF